MVIKMDHEQRIKDKEIVVHVVLAVIITLEPEKRGKRTISISLSLFHHQKELTSFMQRRFVKQEIP